MKLHDTIAAIATPVGSGGIAILRISGKDAQTILAKVGTAKNKKPVSLWESHKLTLCHIHPENRADQPLDQALAVIMRAPHSYTGEDVAEIHCHGGFFAANQILKHLLDAGARLAEPGEFTRRAFLNGKTSLNEAEAVMDLIDASSDLGLTNAARSLNGALSAQLTALREGVMALTAHISATADYPEEVEPPTREETAAQLREIRANIQTLLDTFETGRMLQDGVLTVIVGRPNVGKSSLLNTLLRTERAIVTDIPGTTRDVIEESIAVGGMRLRLMDTAGMRSDADTVEQIGIDRAKEHMQKADLCLFVIDSSRPLEEEDYAIANALSGKRVLALLNKTDKPPCITEEDAAKALQLPASCILKTAVPKDGAAQGIPDLEDAIRRLLLSQRVNAGQVCLSNARQRDALTKAMDALVHAIGANEGAMPFDLLYVDLEDVLSALGEVTGQTVREEIIDEVFGRFCVGK